MSHSAEKSQRQANPFLILVADDDPVMRQSVTDLLRLSGYQVLAAENGAIAWRILQEHTPDLIIADIAMPEMDGYMLYDAVRADPRWSLVPFIFLTARGEKKDVRYGYSLGADHYVTKPFAPDDLLSVVDALLKRMRVVQTAIEADIENTKRRLTDTFGLKLRTPLAAVYGFVSLLQDDLEKLTDEQVKDMLGHIGTGTKRLSDSVNDLLLLLQIDSGTVAVEIERFSQPVDMARIVNDTIQRFSQRAAERQIELESDVVEALPTRGVDSYLADMLVRLVDNAIKFSHPEGGLILISGSRQDDAVHIAIQDSGIGILPDKQKGLFQRFEHIEGKWAEQQDTGLGLVIAMDLAQLHGGTIEVESQENVGSTFTLILPAI